MTSEEIQAVYEELQKMYVHLDPSPERGLGYIRERLTLARAMQDRLAELRLKVNRELSTVLEEQLVAQQRQVVDPNKDNKARISELEILKQRHAMLSKMMTMQAQVLSRTSMDIRLLADLTKEQIKSGEINPNEAPSLIQQVPVTEIGTSPVLPPDFSGLGDKTLTVGDDLPYLGGGMARQTPELPKPAPETIQPPVESIKTIGSSPAGEANEPAQAPVEMTSFDAPSLPEDDRMRVADTSAVSIDDLFQELTHGASAHGRVL